MVQIRRGIPRSRNLIDKRGNAQQELASRRRIQADIAAGRSGGPGTVDSRKLKPVGRPNPNTQGRKAVSAQLFGLARAPANPTRTPIQRPTQNRAIRPKRPVRHPLTTVASNRSRYRGRAVRRRGPQPRVGGR